MIDGYSVDIGDVVYVLGVGSGVVTGIASDGGFTVKTGNGSALYRDGGYIGNQRRVYWANPLIVTPPKNRRFWRAFCAVAQSLYENAATFYDQTTTTSDDDDSDES